MLGIYEAYYANPDTYVPLLGIFVIVYPVVALLISTIVECTIEDVIKRVNFHKWFNVVNAIIGLLISIFLYGCCIIEDYNLFFWTIIIIGCYLIWAFISSAVSIFCVSDNIDAYERKVKETNEDKNIFQTPDNFYKLNE